jgi:hypothetical protein
VETAFQPGARAQPTEFTADSCDTVGCGIFRETRTGSERGGWKTRSSTARIAPLPARNRPARQLRAGLFHGKTKKRSGGPDTSRRRRGKNTAEQRLIGNKTCACLSCPGKLAVLQNSSARGPARTARSCP